jgi:hypothetical protein
LEETVALILDGTTCRLCGKQLRSGEELASFPAFLPAEHRLARYSDAAFHHACFEESIDHEEVETLYELYRSIWASRPRGLKTVAEMEAWSRHAFADFPPRTRSAPVDETLAALVEGWILEDAAEPAFSLEAVERVRLEVAA